MVNGKLTTMAATSFWIPLQTWVQNCIVMLGDVYASEAVELSRVPHPNDPEIIAKECL